MITQTYYGWITDYCSEIILPADCVDDLSGPGQKDEAAKYWRKHIELEHILTDDIFKEVKSTGASVEEYKDDRDTLIEYLIWIVACNIKEDLRSTED